MSARKSDKIQRPKPLPPRGFQDYFGDAVHERNDMLRVISEIYELYGFEALESPAVETVEALGKFLPDVERPNQGIFSWEDVDEGWLSLRYDLTAPLARVYSQFRNNLPYPYRRYSMGPVWRNEKPGPGRFRQFYQCDADTVGASTAVSDAEMCLMLANVIEAVGINSKDYLVRVNNRKVLNGVMETAGLYNPENLSDGAEMRGIVLRSIDKLDRLGSSGVKLLLGKGREDESGDFTKGALLSEMQVDQVMSFLGAKEETGMSITKILQELVKNSTVGQEGVEELKLIMDLANASGKKSENILIDPTIVRGLEYYTGPVFEAELTFEVLDSKGRAQNFGSVAGGGRYDDLVKRFTGQEVPATGISIGIDRLLSAISRPSESAIKSDGPVVVTVMDRERIPDYQSMVNQLRASGIRTELFVGNSRDLKKQLKYADQRKSSVAVICGSNEFELGVVQLKDLNLGAKISSDIKTNKEWKNQPAQIEIKRENIVSEVKALLDKSKFIK